jgi:hypothetical protein
MLRLIASPVGQRNPAPIPPLCWVDARQDLTAPIFGIHKSLCGNCQKVCWQRIYFISDLLTQVSKRCLNKNFTLVNCPPGSTTATNGTLPPSPPPPPPSQTHLPPSRTTSAMLEASIAAKRNTNGNSHHGASASSAPSSNSFNIVDASHAGPGDKRRASKVTNGPMGE